MHAALTALFDLSGTTSVVTGAGRGIGRAVAELFAQAGAKVVVADIDATNAQAVADAIQSNGGQAVAVASDVSNEASVRAMYAKAVEAFGSLDSGMSSNTSSLAKVQFSRFVRSLSAFARMSTGARSATCQPVMQRFGACFSITRYTFPFAKWTLHAL